MNKMTILLAILALAILPASLKAISESEIEDRREMSQVWVDQHNAKLLSEVQSAVKGIRVKAHVYFIGSRHSRLVPMKRARMETASKYGIPPTVKTSSGAVVPLFSLRYSTAEGQSFLTADYADELDTRHCSSDIYIKIGLEYRLLFHGEGYPGCARLISLEQAYRLFLKSASTGEGAVVIRPSTAWIRMPLRV